jgi:hypothetical protein
MERTVARALRTYMRIYSVFRSGRLSTNVKLTLYKAVIRSVRTYACATWEYAADAHLLKLQRLQNRVLRAVGNLDRCTPIRELQVAFKIPYVYDYMYVVLDKEKPDIGSIRGLNLAAVRPTTVHLTNCSFRVVTEVKA